MFETSLLLWFPKFCIKNALMETRNELHAQRKHWLKRKFEEKQKEERHNLEREEDRKLDRKLREV